MTTGDRTPLDLQATPSVARLLAALRGRVVRATLLHGLGTVALVLTGWLCFAYFADWGLRVPKVVRLFHALVLAGLFGVFVWRNLIRPLRRVPRQPGLALLIERAHPDLRELLISAVQFQNPRGRVEPGDPVLVSRVLAQAEERARTLTAKGILRDEPPRKRFLYGAGAAAVAVGLAAAFPSHANIFFNRLAGGSMSWPQRTHLTIELPGLEQQTVARTDEEITLRIARGTDVPIVVRADGVVPGEVRLHFDGGRDLLLNRGGTQSFRTLLRSCQEDLSFHATGGDDQAGLPRVVVQVLQPPDVERVAVHVRPPSYSGLPETLEFDRDVEVLAGSEVSVVVLPFPADATGFAHLTPQDERVSLSPTPFPIDPSASDDLEERDGLGFEFVATESVGYRFELTDGTGLSNPDPGLFRVAVTEDRAPEIQVLAPSRSEFEVVLGGAIPLRARVTDDLGLVSAGWRASVLSPDGEADVASGRLALEAPATGARLAALGATRIDVDGLGTEEHPVGVEQRYVLTFRAIDNREPNANEGQSIPIRARVVTPEELLRRMQERLAKARLDALALSELQREKRSRVEELVDVFDGDGGAQADEGVTLSAVLAGQRRVQGDAQALGRDLAAVAEDILYARLDEKAGPLLDRYDDLARRATDLRFRTAPWRELATAASDGEFGPGGFAQNLVTLVGMALEISEDHALTASRALDDAERALEPGARVQALALASEAQTRSLQRIDALLDALAEWDNFQNILALTRDILHRQKALRERTQSFASEK